MPRYSFVIPVFNEEETLAMLFSEMTKLLEQLDAEAEVILVNDGSSDQSEMLMNQYHQHDPRFKVVHFSRNFGHQIAISAGMDMSQGEAVIVMDADLQDPPEVALDLIAKWKEGYEVVYAVRSSRLEESFFKKLTAKVYYRVLKMLTDIDIPLNVGDFRLVDRKAIDALKSLPERNRFVRGMFCWIGYRQTGVEYVRKGRFAGTTKYPLRKMIKLAMDGVVGFSMMPLRLALRLGVFIAIASVIGGFAAIYIKLAGYFTVPGWTSLIVVVCFLSGIQLMVLGVVGEYIGRIHEEAKNRPLYIVRSAFGFIPESVNTHRVPAHFTYESFSPKQPSL